MARIVTAQNVPTDQCPEGVYAARIGDIKDWLPAEGSQYGDDPQYLWIFQIGKVVHANPVRPTKQNPEPTQPGDWVGKELWGFTSTLLTLVVVPVLWSYLVGPKFSPTRESRPEPADRSGSAIAAR